MKIIDFIIEAMREGKTGRASSKRLGHVAGIFISCVISLILTGIVVGMSIGIAEAQFQFVYGNLLNTLLILCGMLMGAATTAYITTKKTEGKDNEQP